MYRAIPVINKACTERVRKREHDMHKARIRSMRAQVDTEKPSTCHLDHLRNNLKREQLLEDRYYEIDRENKILLQKMSEMMKSKPSGLGGRGKSVPSLQRDSRKTELMRITQDNQAILRRIQQAQPVYSVVEWEDSYRKSAGYMKNTCEYPVVLKRKMPRSQSLVPLDGTGTFRGTGMEVQRKGLGANGEVAAPLQDLPGEELRYVLKEGKRIGERLYLVEMATDGRTLAISAYDGETQQTLELLINERNHRKLFRATGDYNAIADKLRVENDQLVLPLDAVGGSPLGASGGTPP